jgi:hypothetical protein
MSSRDKLTVKLEACGVGKYFENAKRKYQDKKFLYVI